MNESLVGTLMKYKVLLKNNEKKLEKEHEKYEKHYSGKKVQEGLTGVQGTSC